MINTGMLCLHADRLTRGDPVCRFPVIASLIFCLFGLKMAIHDRHILWGTWRLHGSNINAIILVRIRECFRIEWRRPVDGIDGLILTSFRRSYGCFSKKL